MPRRSATVGAARTSAATPRLRECSGQATTSVAGGRSTPGHVRHRPLRAAGGERRREDRTRRTEPDEREQLREVRHAPPSICRSARPSTSAGRTPRSVRHTSTAPGSGWSRSSRGWRTGAGRDRGGRTRRGAAGGRTAEAPCGGSRPRAWTRSSTPSAAAPSPREWPPPSRGALLADGRVRSANHRLDRKPERLAALARLVTEGTLRPVIGAGLPLDEAPRAPSAETYGR